MTQALADLLGSKKFLIALATIITTIGLKLGFDIDQQTVAMVLGFGSVLITGYAIQGHGKDAAAIYADADGDGIPDQLDDTPNGDEIPVEVDPSAMMTRGGSPLRPSDVTGEPTPGHLK